jgi:hypothetical protein
LVKTEQGKNEETGGDIEIKLDRDQSENFDVKKFCFVIFEARTNRKPDLGTR